MPQASGIALGFDRLVMLATGATDIEQVIWTPVAERGASVSAETGATAPLRTADALFAAGLDRGRTTRGARDRRGARRSRITPPIAALIDRDDPNDPIARQFVPDARRTRSRPEERADPIGDGAHSPVEGIVHRYPDRVLLKLLHVCPVYCRFCFRREMVGPGGPAASCRPRRSTPRSTISAPHRRSGKSSSPAAIRWRCRRAGSARSSALAAIEHVKIVRLHTRVPVVDPARVSDALVECLRNARQDGLCRAACQSSARIDGAAQAACARLIDAGIPMV